MNCRTQQLSDPANLKERQLYASLTFFVFENFIYNIHELNLHNDFFFESNCLERANQDFVEKTSKMIELGEWSAVCTVRPKSRLVSGEEQTSHVRRMAYVLGTHLIVSYK